MILSYHPNIVAHRNILCAGRLPNEQDKEAISKADAVILPQGPSEVLYRMCRKHCPNVFPNYDARFDFPGKLGQARLFEKYETPFPKTYTFERVAHFDESFGNSNPMDYPFIFKSDWGGEGEGVFLVKSNQALMERLKRAERFEKSGQKGFLLQTFVPHGKRTLRVVIVGHQCFSYWRLQSTESEFRSNLKSGALIDHDSNGLCQEVGKKAVVNFCAKTRINLAGFDLLFPEQEKRQSTALFRDQLFFWQKRPWRLIEILRNG